MLGDSNWGLNMVGGCFLLFYIEPPIKPHVVKIRVMCWSCSLSSALGWNKMRNILRENDLGDHFSLVGKQKSTGCSALQFLPLFLFVRQICKFFVCFFNTFLLRRIDRRFILTAKWTGFRDEKRKCETASHPNPHPFCLPQAGKCEQYKT